MNWIAILMVLSLVSEGTGTFLLIREIFGAKKAADEFERRGEVHYGGARLEARGGLRGKASGGREPSLEEKMRLLEERVFSVESRIDDVPQQWRQDIEEAVSRVEQWARTRVEPTERLLVGLAAGSFRRQMCGLALIIFGILAGGAANLWSVW